MLKEKLAKEGAFLFRWRSYIPLVLLLPAIIALSDSAYIDEKYADPIVLAGFLISVTGLAIRWLTVGFVPGGTSGRNTKEQRADQLNTKGMYSIVKNPLYLGNFIAILGILISIKVWWMVLMGSVLYWLYIERIIAAEEEFLTQKYGKTYHQWANVTPTFIPDFKLWKPAPARFSFKTVFKREYNGFMAVCSVFFIVEMFQDLYLEKENFGFWLHEDWPWAFVMAIGTLTFVTLRFLKKHTRVLHVGGR